MKFALVIGVVVAIVAVQSQLADPCAADSCQACGQRSADCHYCAVQVENDLLQKDVLGVCVDQNLACEAVSFGSFVETRIAALSLIGLQSQNVEVNFEDQQRCKDTFTPDEIKLATCQDCVGQNFTWVATNTDQAGICVRKDLAIFFNFYLLTHANIIEEASLCGRSPALPLPSDVCEENLYCQACGRAGCEWCGGMLTVNQTSIFSLKGGLEGAVSEIPLFGTCRPPSSDRCESFGTIDNLFQIGKLLGYTDFAVQKLVRGDFGCDNIQWLESLKKDCQTCVADNQVFCNWNLNLPLPIPGAFGGGLCLPMDLEPLCKTISVNALPSTAIVDAGGCPA